MFRFFVGFFGFGIDFGFFFYIGVGFGFDLSLRGGLSIMMRAKH